LRFYGAFKVPVKKCGSELYQSPTGIQCIQALFQKSSFGFEMSQREGVCVRFQRLFYFSETTAEFRFGCMDKPIVGKIAPCQYRVDAIKSRLRSVAHGNSDGAI
jgi:hypothetical protein